MFFEDAKDIDEIARRSGTAIFVVPNDQVVDIKNAILR